MVTGLVLNFDSVKKAREDATTISACKNKYAKQLGNMIQNIVTYKKKHYIWFNSIATRWQDKGQGAGGTKKTWVKFLVWSIGTSV